MNRKEFLSLLLVSLLAPKIKAQYDEAPTLQRTEKDMAYILLNLYESPPRWLFDLPLKTDPGNFVGFPMISTKLKEGAPFYETLKMKGINFPSLWENSIQTQAGPRPMQELLDQMIIIRGCNMNKDGHDLNSRVLEATATGKTSIGGRIADHYKAHFPCLAVGGTMADPFKSVVSSFNTSEGLKAFVCKEEAKSNYIAQVLALYKAETIGSENTHAILDNIASASKDSDPLTYKQITELQKLPFDEIFSFFEQSFQKYQKLLELSLEKDSIKNLTDVAVPGVKLPARFKLNKEKSQKPLDYMGAYQFDSYILTGPDINKMFKNRKVINIAKNFALAETALKFSLSNVLILNLDPLTHIELEEVAPLKDISVTLEGDDIIFDCPKDKLHSSKKGGIKMSFDAHFIGTYPALLGYSRYYQHLATGLYEFKNFLQSHKKNNKTLFENSLIHLTSEFERAPQKNQAGSDHGWSGHTSTFISGRFEGVKLIGSIAKESTNALGNLKCTWGGASKYAPIKRQMRYGDIVHSIATFFKVNPTQGGVSLIKWQGDKLIPAFENREKT